MAKNNAADHSSATPDEQKPSEHLVNRAPETPLPWELDDELNVYGRGSDRPTATWQGKDGDAAYIVHSANAYPRLVEALKNTGFKFGALPDEARNLLRELGEF